MIPLVDEHEYRFRWGWIHTSTPSATPVAPRAPPSLHHGLTSLEHHVSDVLALRDVNDVLALEK